MAVTRLSGFSGMDTDQMIKDLMKAESAKLTKVKQSRDYKVWEQEAYRDIIKSIRTFQGSFFDILKPDSSLRSASLFAKFTSDVKIGTTASTAVSVTGNADITSFEHTISSIVLATKDTWTGSTGAGVTGVDSQALDFGAGKPATFQVSLSVDGTAKTINLDMAAVNDIDTFVTQLNTQIQTAFGANYSNVVSKVGADAVNFNSPGSTVKVMTSGGFEDSMTWLGITSGAGSLDYSGKTVADVLGLTETDLDNMTIAGKSLTYLGVSTTTTFSDMLVKINNGNVGVKASFNSISDKFTLTSLDEGAVNAMTLSATLKTKLGLDSNTAGQDAQFTLDGVALVKSKNTFTIEGVNYTLKENYNGASGNINIKLTTDTGTIKDKIKSFVESYNTLIGDLNSKISEKVYRDYQPLTDEEKEAMTEDEIKLWETKAKSGIVRNSSEISNMLTKMRQALYETVSGAGISMSEIGISSSSNYKEGGKLTLDESKLEAALTSKYDRVVKLFTAESDKDYLESGTASERYLENGIGNRLNDILSDAIRTTRDNDNKKGSLIEKAGIESDLSFYRNTITESILQYESRITTMIDTLADKEDAYYLAFSRMESALTQMNNQSSWLSSQLGGS